MLLDEPITIQITDQFLKSLHNNKIATSADINVFNQIGGWLAELDSYTFRHRILIEGPCGFYGGIYGPNIWSMSGGLCTMGSFSYSHSPLPEGMIIGRYCSIGKGLRFLDFAHPTEWVSSSVAFFRPSNSKNLTTIHHLIDGINNKNETFKRLEFDPTLGMKYPIIENDVWIGENVTLSMGITICTGAVIASGSIVTHDIPPYAIVAGVPAKIRKYRFNDSLCMDLLESKWWEYDFRDFKGIDIKNPEIFLLYLSDKITYSNIDKWVPYHIVLPN